MTRNKFQDTLKTIAGGNPNGALGGGAATTPRLQDLSNFVTQGTLTNGQVAYWNGLNWTNDVPDTVISHWVSTVEYNAGAVVEYNGRWWKAINHSINKAPTRKEFFWRPVEMDIVRWQPDTAYPMGTIVLVPWDMSFFHDFDPDALAAAQTNHYTLWVAKSDIPATASHAANEPVSPCRVPPGMFVPLNQDPTQDAGGSSYPNDWSPVTSPAFYIVDAATKLLTMDFHGPVVYGTLALVTAGKAAGNVFEYRRQINAGVTNHEFVERRGWHSVGYIGELTGLSKYIDDKVAPLISGIQHGASVIDIVDTPTGTESVGARYIISKNPTGDFTGHANETAFKDSTYGWIFGKPGTNEAHLNEKDNVVYHWSGTEWNRIGSVASGELKQLTDVDVKTKAPAAGDFLQYDGTNWVNKTPPTGGPIIKSFSRQIGARQAPAIIELEQANWQSLELTACLEIRDIASHLTFSLLQANGTVAVSSSDCFQASQGLTYGNDQNHRSVFIPSKSTAFFPNEAKFGMTWLPANAGGNDQVSINNSPYVMVRMSFVRMYDNYLTIDGDMYYGSYGGEGYRMNWKYMFGAAAGVPLIKKIQFNVENTARIGAAGNYTLLPWG